MPDLARAGGGGVYYIGLTYHYNKFLPGQRAGQDHLPAVSWPAQHQLESATTLQSASITLMQGHLSANRQHIPHGWKGLEMKNHFFNFQAKRK